MGILCDPTMLLSTDSSSGTAESDDNMDDDEYFGNSCEKVMFNRYYRTLSQIVQRCNESPVLTDECKQWMHQKFMDQIIVRHGNNRDQNNNKNGGGDGGDDEDDNRDIRDKRDDQRQVKKFGSLVSLFHSLDDGRIMTLWKSLLLGRRVLFFSDIPLGPLSSKVAACRKLFLSQSALNDHGPYLFQGKDLDNESETGEKLKSNIPQQQQQQQQQHPQYLYYVCTNDLAYLSNHRTMSYVACTTDRIFEMRRNKRHQSPPKSSDRKKRQRRNSRNKVEDHNNQSVCDLFIDKRVINFEHADDAHVLQVTDSDRWHTEEMKRRVLSMNDEEDQERELLDYFSNLNLQLFTVLKALSTRDPNDDGIVCMDHFLYMGKALNLNTKDIPFMQRMIEEYGGDVEIELPKSWFRRCCCCCC